MTISIDYEKAFTEGPVFIQMAVQRKSLEKELQTRKLSVVKQNW